LFLKAPAEKAHSKQKHLIMYLHTYAILIQLQIWKI
jgi:hypothetical protein